MNDSEKTRDALISGGKWRKEAQDTHRLRSRGYHPSLCTHDVETFGTAHDKPEAMIFFGRFVASGRTGAVEWGGAQGELISQIVMRATPTGESGPFRFNRLGKTRSPKLHMAA
nr:hypothetical protein [uncultured Cohaesibacter sp.]